jgi:luciferase family oxidoreductase group 1
LPYAFASHFAPRDLFAALQVYRQNFEPSEQLDRPYAAAGINVCAAETDTQAQRLFTSAQQQFTNLIRGTPGRLPPPIDDMESYWTLAEKSHVTRMLACSFVGSQATVSQGLKEFVHQTRVEELIVASAIYEHSARLRSYEILKDAIQ